MRTIHSFCVCLILFIFQTASSRAQTDQPQPTTASRLSDTANDSIAQSPLAPAGELMQEQVDANWNSPVVPIAPYGLGAYGLGGLSPYSYYMDGGASWRLHDGFNAQFGMSISAGLGKHAPKGVGFGQQAAFAYVMPITPKLSIAAGIFATNMDWGSWQRTDVGIGGTLAYQVNDRINLYAYGTKSFVPRANDFKFRRDPFPLFLEQQRDRIGAAAEFKIGQNAMIGVSVERSSY